MGKDIPTRTFKQTIMKYKTKYLPIPDRINDEGTNVMFRINDEWTPPSDFDSLIGPEIQGVGGGVLFLYNEKTEPIELVDQTLKAGLEFDRNDFEVKWVNSKGETSLTMKDVDNEDLPPKLKAFIKTTLK